MENSLENKKPDLKKSLFSLRTLIGFLVGGAVIVYFFRNFDIHAARETLSHIKWHYFVLGTLFFYISIPLRGARWKLQLKPIGYNEDPGKLTHYYFLAMFANALLPARLGDIYRAYLLKKNRSISISLSFGIFFSERVFDLAVISTLVVFSGSYFWSAVKGSTEGDYIIYGFMAVLLIVTVFIVALGAIPRLVEYTPQKLKSRLMSFHEGLFKHPSQLLIILMLTVSIWMCEALRLYFVFMAFGAQAGILLAIFISQAALVLMAVPISPAGLGIVELMMLKVLSFSGLSPGLAGALTICDRLISYWSVLALGGLCYLFSTRVR